jgi:hypothetical protein
MARLARVSGAMPRSIIVTIVIIVSVWGEKSLKVFSL